MFKNVCTKISGDVYYTKFSWLPISHRCLPMWSQSSMYATASLIKNSLNELAYKEVHKRKNKKWQYSLTDECANQIANCIKRNQQKNDIILDMVSGDGKLLSAMAKTMPNTIISYNRNANFNPDLSDSDHKNNIVMSINELKKFYTYMVKYKKCPGSTEINDIIHEISTYSSDNSDVVIMANLKSNKESSKVLHHLSNTFCNKRGLYEQLHPTWYLKVPKSIHKGLYEGKLSPSRWRVLRLLRIYFNVISYGNMEESTISREGVVFERTTSYLVKLVPNLHLYDRISNMSAFDFFVNKLLRTKLQATTINTLEEFIPNCGVTFIKNGFEAIAHPSSLTKDELIRSFEIFSNLPSYEESYFIKQWERHVDIFGDFASLEEMEADLDGDDEMGYA